MTAHTALHASQAHAAKSDEASPFSILLEQVAPKDDKAKLKDKDASDDADDAKDTKTDTVKADSKTDAKADAPTSKADKNDKAEKSDKPEDTAKAAETDATQVAADAPAQSPVVPPAPVAVAVPPAPMAAAATPAPNEANSDIEAINGAANAAPAPQADKTGKTAAAPQDDDQADDSTADTPATDAAAPQDMPQDIKGAAKPAPRKPLQAAADTKPGKPDAIKADTAKTNSTKADSTKPDAPQPDKVAAATDAPAPKPAPPAASTNLAVHDITAPQAPQTNVPGAPSVTQHVQVAQQTPAPAPNMPALAVEISAKSQSGAKQFDIRLDPPELGRVEVRLSIDAAGKASAHLSADQPQTLDLLQKDSTSLMRALRDAGLNVSQDGLNFSLRQQSHQDSGAHQGGGRSTTRNFALTATTSLEATTTSAAFSRPADGRVDISV